MSPNLNVTNAAIVPASPEKGPPGEDGSCSLDLGSC